MLAPFRGNRNQRYLRLLGTIIIEDLDVGATTEVLYQAYGTEYQTFDGQVGTVAEGVALTTWTSPAISPPTEGFHITLRAQGPSGFWYAVTHTHDSYGYNDRCEWAWEVRGVLGSAASQENPILTRSDSYASGAADLVRLRTCPQGMDGVLLALAQAVGGDWEHHAVLRFSGSALTQWADLSGYAATPSDFAVWQDRVVCACGSDLVFLDIATGEEVFVQPPLEGMTEWAAVEPLGDDLMLTATTDQFNTQLVRLTPAYQSQSVGVTPAAQVMCDSGAGLILGCMGGSIRQYADGDLSVLLETGAGDFSRVARCGTLTLVGAQGKCYSSQPAWHLDYEFPGLSWLRGFAYAKGTVFGGGDGSPALWYRQRDGAWAVHSSLDCTGLRDMLASGNVLYVGTSHATNAPLYRLQ